MWEAQAARRYFHTVMAGWTGTISTLARSTVGNIVIIHPVIISVLSFKSYRRLAPVRTLYYDQESGLAREVEAILCSREYHRRGLRPTHGAATAVVARTDRPRRTLCIRASRARTVIAEFLFFYHRQTFIFVRLRHSSGVSW